MKPNLYRLLFIILIVSSSVVLAEITPVINYTDSVPGVPVSLKAAYFKFAIVDPGVSESRPGINGSAVAILSRGKLSRVVVMSAGEGYQSPPVITISGGGGSGAKVTAVLTNGMVSSVRVDAKGSGYSFSPTLTIAPPPNVLTLKHTTYWSNDGSSVEGAEPLKSIPLTMSAGSFTVHLGDPTYGEAMQSLPTSLSEKSECHLKVWYADKLEGPFNALEPDQTLGGGLLAFYALRAGVAEQLASTAMLSGSQIAEGSIAAKHLSAELAGALPVWQPVASPVFTASPNKAYMVAPGNKSTIILPSDVKLGDVVRVIGIGAKVEASAGQSIEKWTLRLLPKASEDESMTLSQLAMSDNATILFAATESTLYRSLDSAQTWSKILTGGSASYQEDGWLIGCSGDGRSVLAWTMNASSGEDDLMASNNAATSWTKA
ncbi:MAG: hypothetical protein EBS96_11375, partial [Spartobacteria bacterium]|nr:hypothetical protein [Spartobacteria bacterium]